MAGAECLLSAKTIKKNDMKRRDVLKGAGLGLMGVAGAVRADEAPAIRWRLASSFPKSVDAIYGAAERVARRVGEVTSGKFQIRVFAGGEIVPGLQVLDAVGQATVECGQTAGYYYVGKNMAFAFETALPFGLNARQQIAWMYAGGGRGLMRDLYKDHGVVMFPGGDIYPALESGALDATEWVGPYDDEKLGFHKVAKHYYYPGWWEPGPQISFYVNLKKWQELPPAYQAAFETAAAEANLYMLAEYDAKNPPALQRLLRQGVKLHAFPKDVMLAARKTAFEMYEEEARQNATFRRIYVEWKKFAAAGDQWFKVAESSYANFMHYVK